LQSVCKFFPSKGSGEVVQALDQVSFSVRHGEFVSLLGRSGCGKSTLLSVMAGLQSPDSGSVVMDGDPVIGPNRRCMLMFQDAALFPWLNVFDNVLYGLKHIAGLKKREMLERAEVYLDLVGLLRFGKFRVHELSGGMRQRAALARALAPEPEVLLMDEPFSALDAMTREQLYADMQRIWQKTAKTIFMVTHNAREASCLSGRVMVMEAQGRIVGDEIIGLPYPRSMNDIGVTQSAARISSLLRQAADVGGA
jgi:NitT/TauT family transport system ATP-binding protein